MPLGGMVLWMIVNNRQRRFWCCGFVVIKLSEERKLLFSPSAGPLSFVRCAFLESTSQLADRFIGQEGFLKTLRVDIGKEIAQFGKGKGRVHRYSRALLGSDLLIAI